MSLTHDQWSALNALRAGRTVPDSQSRSAVQAALDEIDLLKAKLTAPPAPIPLLLHCPMCHARHVDEGEQATTPHRTHACQNPRCGHLWAPAIVPTVGVWTLPGCLNAPIDGHRWVPLYERADVERCVRCDVQRRRAGDSWQWRLHADQAKWLTNDYPTCDDVAPTKLSGHHETCLYTGAGVWKCVEGCRVGRRWDGAGAHTRACPTCGAAPNHPCTQRRGAPPMTVGDYGPDLHEARCWL